MATTFTSAGTSTDDTSALVRSEVYTMPASASPDWTLATTEASSGSFDTTFGITCWVRFALSSISRA